MKADYVVVGGGIAGVTCIETLCQLEENATILLLSASPLVKTVTNFLQVTRHSETFDVEERPLEEVKKTGNVTVLHSVVASLVSDNNTIVTEDGTKIKYKKLCLCTGGKPKVISQDSQYVLGIRDTESVKDFQQRVKSARRLLIVGNGGIATELVYELEGCDVVWAIKDKSITHTFVDAGAAQFLLDQLNKEKDKSNQGPLKRLKYMEGDSTSVPRGNVMGGALGPDWASNLDIHGPSSSSHNVTVEYETEINEILSPAQFDASGLELTHTKHINSQEPRVDPPWPVFARLANGKVYGCDLIVSATGVIPFTEPFLRGNDFQLAEDSGLKVNDKMETNVKDVYAAGDVCTASWDFSKNWFQMRLWSQARQMGCYAAKSMIASVKNEEISLDFCFELFAHVTNFFRFKVVLLGLFNAQGLKEEYEVLLRTTKDNEYVKVILQDGRLMGAVLIGETDLEETFENLILNGTDLTPFKEHLLEPGIDIEDFFD